jgi:hypothetical protein
MKSEFLTGNLVFTDISRDGDVLRIRLEKDFAVFSSVTLSVITVPTGFECDGESVPKILASIVPPFGASRRGAVIHDWLYTNAGYRDVNGVFVPVTRETADLVYRDLLILAGLPKWRAYNRWFQLRLYGWVAWNAHRKNDFAKVSNDLPTGHRGGSDRTR